MNFPLTGMIRLATLAGLALGVAAIGLGRMNEPTESPKVAAPARHVGLGGQIIRIPGSGADLLNLETGQVDRLKLPAGEELDQVSCSPWRDGNGEEHIVGRRAILGEGFIARGFGLARYSYPSGRIVDEVSTDVLPTSPPCWYPGTSSRILFAALDGGLYHFTFGESGEATADSTPQPLTWREMPPGMRDVIMIDPNWSSKPSMGGRILVALNARAKGHVRFEGSKVWWIQLNPAGTEILKARRLTIPRDTSVSDTEDEERLPVVGTSASGELLLSYLARVPHESGWRLMVSPIHLDAETGEPFTRTTEARALVANRAPLAPTFSLDGRWVASLPLRDSSSPIFQRTPLDAELASSSR